MIDALSQAVTWTKPNQSIYPALLEMLRLGVPHHTAEHLVLVVEPFKQVINIVD